MGQFIDERHKMFFDNHMSGRYGDIPINNRIIYIFKDDDIEMGHLESIKDKVYFHLKDYANEYFRFEFLDILSREAGKTLIAYKHRLDKIKLRRNHLKEVYCVWDRIRNAWDGITGTYPLCYADESHGL